MDRTVTFVQSSAKEFELVRTGTTLLDVVRRGAASVSYAVLHTCLVTWLSKIYRRVAEAAHVMQVCVPVPIFGMYTRCLIFPIHLRGPSETSHNFETCGVILVSKVDQGICFVRCNQHQGSMLGLLKVGSQSLA